MCQRVYSLGMFGLCICCWLLKGHGDVILSDSSLVLAPVWWSKDGPDDLVEAWLHKDHHEMLPWFHHISSQGHVLNVKFASKFVVLTCFDQFGVVSSDLQTAQLMVPIPQDFMKDEVANYMKDATCMDMVTEYLVPPDPVNVI